MKAAIWAETVKLAGSLVGRVATVALIAGITALSSSLLVAAGSGDPQLLAKLGPAASGDWKGFLLAAAQITGAGGVAGYGIVLAWMFGREFADGTITGLFALPVGRARIALAKLVVYFGWACGVGLVLTVALAGLGAVVGIEGFGSFVAPMLAREFVLAMLTALLALPIAWVATLGRSTLAGVGAAVALIVIAQFSVFAGAGGWMPLAAPALWAISEGTAVDPLQLSMVFPVAALAVLLTATTWSRLQLDR
jgi:ABC-2 type transport system permease protein